MPKIYYDRNSDTLRRLWETYGSPECMINMDCPYLRVDVRDGVAFMVRLENWVENNWLH